MNSEKTIRRLGFRKWYERELLYSHGNLVVLLLAAIGLLGSLEVYSAKLAFVDQLQVAGAAVASVVIGYLALRRYLYLLNHAEFVAHQAVCGGCQTYAKWDAVDDHAGQARMRVRCRRCGHGWEIEV